jgi:hypothetical protein
MCMKTKKTGGKMSAFIAQLLGNLQGFRLILAKLGRNCDVRELNWLKFTPNRNGVDHYALIRNPPRLLRVGRRLLRCAFS